MNTGVDLLHTTNLRQRLKQGKACLGMWIGITDPLAVEAIAADCTLDWILVCMEHGGVGWSDLKSILLGWKGSEIPVFVRVPSHDPTFIARVLDLGASGVVVPFVNTPIDAAKIVSACRYPPLGSRGNAPTRVSRYYTKTLEYNSTANDHVFVMVQIEHVQAVENVDEISQVPGLDALFIGIGDMSYSMGIPRQWDNPMLGSAIQKVVNAGKSSGIPVAMAVDSTPEEVCQRIKQGIQLTTVGIDWMLMRNAINRQVSEIKKLME